MAPPIALLDAALRGALVVLAILLGVKLAREVHAGRLPRNVSGGPPVPDFPRRAMARAGTLLMAGLVVQTVISLPWLEAQPPQPWVAPLIGISVGNSVLFWIFARSLFDDEADLDARHWATWAGMVGLGTAFFFVVVLHACQDVGGLALLLKMAMRWTPLLFAALVLKAVINNWRADLVEARRRLRLFLLVSGSLYTVFTAVARLTSADGRLSPVAASADTGVLLSIIAVMALRVLRLDAADLFPPAPGPAPVPGPAPADVPDPADERLAAELVQLMQGEQLFRSEGLTLATLASRLRTPEYRLRRHINQRLGHRNFNAYINGFRLDHARAALADPARSEVPVLTIALDAGFQSIGPFNRAFKADTGLTPSEYRRRQLAVS